MSNGFSMSPDNFRGRQDDDDDFFKFDKKAIDVLYSNNEDYILQVTDLDQGGIRMATALEIIDAFIVDRFCFDVAHKQLFKRVKKRIYQIPISKDRKGREELFNTIGNIKELEILKTKIEGMNSFSTGV